MSFLLTHRILYLISFWSIVYNIQSNKKYSVSTNLQKKKWINAIHFLIFYDSSMNSSLHSALD